LSKGLLFSVRGYMAHFRKVYSNSTSLSYYFPPRTTLMGLVAAAMGKDRDSYYEELDHYDFAVRPITGLRKLISGQTYLDTDQVSLEKLRRIKQGVPTAVELVVADGADYLGYEILVHPLEHSMKEAIKSPVYQLSLGTANMLAWVEDVREEECEEFDHLDGDVHSVTTLKPKLEDFNLWGKDMLKIGIEEGVPRRFDKDRHSGPLSSYFVELNGKPFKVSGDAKGVVCGGKKYAFL